MGSRNNVLVVFGLIAIIILLIGGLTWLNLRISDRFSGTDSFLACWMGTRLLLTEGISPYDDIVSKQIRDKSEELYGQKQPAKSAQVFYPLYSGLIYFPYALIEDYLLAHSLWMTTLEIALIGLAIACLKVTRWRVPAIMFVLYFFFCLFWIHSIMPLITGNVVIIVALCLTLSVLAIRSGYDELAGILLAVSTIKPLVAIWLIVFLVIWAVFQRRWKIPIWFGGTLIILIVVSVFFFQSWLLDYLRTMFLYIRSSLPLTPAPTFKVWLPGIGERLGWLTSILLGVVLMIEWIAGSKKPDFRRMLWLACLTLVIGQGISFLSDPINAIVLLLPLVVVFSVLDERWKRTGRIIDGFLIILLLIVPWAIIYPELNHVAEVEKLTILLFPLPLFILIGLYWIRWWAIRPQRTYMQELRDVAE